MHERHVRGAGRGVGARDPNELWVADTFKNIKFSNNIHSFGGYFMWAPGAYLPDRGEGDEVHANIGIEKYFFEAGDKILNRIKEQRDTVILPERTGPIADVLYSAAGNSADEHWYNRGTIAYSFETGADLFVEHVAERRGRAGATGIRAANRTCFAPGDTIKVDAGTANEESARSRRSSTRTRRAPAAEHHAHAAAVTGARGGRGARRRDLPDRASASSRTTPRRASTRRSSSRTATTGCSSRRSSTRAITRRRRCG